MSSAIRIVAAANVQFLRKTPSFACVRNEPVSHRPERIAAATTGFGRLAGATCKAACANG